MIDPVHAYLFALVESVEKKMPNPAPAPSMVVVCGACRGDGFHTDYAANDWAFEQVSKCPRCSGSGRIATNGGEV